MSRYTWSLFGAFSPRMRNLYCTKPLPEIANDLGQALQSRNEGIIPDAKASISDAHLQGHRALFSKRPRPRRQPASGMPDWQSAAHPLTADYAGMGDTILQFLTET